MVLQTSSISTDLLDHLRKLYSIALEEVISGKFSRQGMNGFTSCAIPAYIIASTTIEAFVNEMFTSPAGRSFFKETATDDFWKREEKRELADKLLELPKLYFGETFDNSSLPYQDMRLLIKLRNDLVHYKMLFETPKYVKLLQQRHIALKLPNSSWVKNVSSSEGIRWAHNTVCETIKKFGDFKNVNQHPLLLAMVDHEFFNPIQESVVKNWFAEKGVIV